MVVAIVHSGGVLYMFGYKEEDWKVKFIGIGVIHNVADGMLHGKVIGKHYVSLTITESYKDNYPLLKPLTGDDPPLTTISQAKAISFFGKVTV